MAALVLWSGTAAMGGGIEIGVIYVFVNYLGRLAEQWGERGAGIIGAGIDGM